MCFQAKDGLVFIQKIRISRQLNAHFERFLRLAVKLERFSHFLGLFFFKTCGLTSSFNMLLDSLTSKLSLFVVNVLEI